MFLQNIRVHSPVRFLRVAQAELDAAIEYYNGEQSGLGNVFLLEVLHVLNRIVTHPQAWHPCTRSTRRCMLHRFPYGVLYQIRQQEILVVAVANLHRNPDYWIDRL
ncbi:MAG: type II toxin-antitoxin system RelE/ParE family toxin [Chlorobium sp.]